jgi:hypothetical protein
MSFPVDIHTTVSVRAELMQVKGIGDATSAKIFKCVQDHKGQLNLEILVQESGQGREK